MSTEIPPTSVGDTTPGGVAVVQTPPIPPAPQIPSLVFGSNSPLSPFSPGEQTAKSEGTGPRKTFSFKNKFGPIGPEVKNTEAQQAFGDELSPNLNTGNLYISELDSTDVEQQEYDMSEVDGAGKSVNLQAAMNSFLDLAKTAGIFISKDMANYMFYEFHARKVIVNEDMMKAILLGISVERNFSNQKTVEELTTALAKETANLKKVSNAIIETKKEILDGTKMAVKEVTMEAKKMMKEIIELGMSDIPEPSLPQTKTQSIVTPLGKDETANLIDRIKSMSNEPPLSTKVQMPASVSTVVPPKTAPQYASTVAVQTEVNDEEIEQMEAKIQAMLTAGKPVIPIQPTLWKLTPDDGKKVDSASIDKVDLQYLPLTNDTPAFLSHFRRMWCGQLRITDKVLVKTIRNSLSLKEKTLLYYNKVTDEYAEKLKKRFLSRMIEEMKIERQGTSTVV